MTEIAPYSAGFDKLRQYRNFLAHSTLKEIDDELEFEDRFREIEDAVDALFEPHPERRRHWRDILRQIRRDDIVAIESRIVGFDEALALLVLYIYIPGVGRVRDAALLLNFQKNEPDGSTFF